MPWTYRQSTGALSDPQGRYLATGYSGSGIGKNNPFREGEQDIGPIPRGSYQIRKAHFSPHTGPISMNLTAMPSTHTFGRDAFLIHGDNISHTASHGCIVLPRSVREQINRSSDRTLVVQ